MERDRESGRELGLSQTPGHPVELLQRRLYVRIPWRASNKPNPGALPPETLTPLAWGRAWALVYFKNYSG